MTNNFDLQKNFPDLKSGNNESNEKTFNENSHNDSGNQINSNADQIVVPIEGDESNNFFSECDNSVETGKLNNTPNPGKQESSYDFFLEQVQILQNKQDELARNHEQLLQLVIEQNNLFKTKFLHDEQKEGLIDKMHTELQTLRSNLYKNLIKPILIDIISLRESMRRMEYDLNKKYPDGLIPIKTFSDYLHDLADVLEEHDVEIFEEKPGTKFMPGKQKIINRLDTNDKDMSGLIARSISSGYVFNNQIISQQKVDVYYSPEETTQNNESTKTGNQPLYNEE